MKTKLMVNIEELKKKLHLAETQGYVEVMVEGRVSE